MSNLVQFAGERADRHVQREHDDDDDHAGKQAVAAAFKGFRTERAFYFCFEILFFSHQLHLRFSTDCTLRNKNRAMTLR